MQAMRRARPTACRLSEVSELNQLNPDEKTDEEKIEWVLTIVMVLNYSVLSPYSSIRRGKAWRTGTRDKQAAGKIIAPHRTISACSHI